MVATKGETGWGQGKKKKVCRKWKKKNVSNAQMLEVSPSGVRTVLRLESDAWSMVK